MPLEITAIYATVLTVMLIVLRTMVSIKRGKSNISILHGDDMALAETMRRHGNFVENVPMTLILMGLAEAGGGGTMWLHIAGALLVASRVAHPLGLDHKNTTAPLRIVGGIGTTIAMVIPMVLIVGRYV